MKHQFKDQAPKPAPVVEEVVSVESENQVQDIPVEEAPVKPELKDAVITGAPLVNFRKEPSADAPVIDILSNGEAIKVADTRGDWTAVVARERQGFVMSKYIK